MIGKTISHYSVLEKLGQGEMSVVYRSIRNCSERAAGGFARRLGVKCSLLGLSVGAGAATAHLF